MGAVDLTISNRVFWGFGRSRLCCHIGSSRKIRLNDARGKQLFLDTILRPYLGAFTKATVNLCHVCPRGTSLLPTGQIFIEFDIWVFLENLSRKFEFFWGQTRITGSLHDDQYTLMTISRSFVLRMRNVSDKICTENQNTHFVFNVFFFSKIVCLLDNLIFEHFWKIYQENLSFIEVKQEYRVLYMKTNIHFWSYLAHLFLEWEMFQTKVVEKTKTHILCSVILPRKLCCLLDNLIFEHFWKNLSRKFEFYWGQTRITGTLYDGQHTFLIISRWVLLRMRNVSDKSCTENQNTHFVFIANFPENRAVYGIMCEKHRRAGQATRQYGACALHAGYLRLQTHTHIM